MRRLLLPFALFSAFAVAGCASTASDEVASARTLRPPRPPPTRRPPPPPAPRPVAELVRQVDIPYEQFTLDNGLRVVVHEDRKAPVVAVTIWYNVGSKDEPAGKTGFAHLFEHLMFNGSENAPGDYFEPLREIGATDFNGTTWFDRTNYFQTVPAPGAGARPVPRERPHGPSARRGRPRRSSPTRSASSRTRSARATTSPTAWSNMPSSRRCSRKATPIATRRSARWPISTPPRLEDVQDWFRDNYGPNNAVLVLAGDISAAEARPLVEKLFRRHPARPGQQAGRRPTCRPCRRRKVEVMKDRVANTRLYRNWVVPGLLDRRRRSSSTSPPACSAASPARGSTTRWCASDQTAVRRHAPASSPSTGSACSRSRST